MRKTKKRKPAKRRAKEKRLVLISMLGVLVALFFAGLLILLSKGDVSFVWPLTSLSFVMTAIAARLFLHEQIVPARWAGICLIMAGAALITWSEKRQKDPHPPALAKLQNHQDGRSKRTDCGS